MHIAHYLEHPYHRYHYPYPRHHPGYYPYGAPVDRLSRSPPRGRPDIEEIREPKSPKDVEAVKQASIKPISPRRSPARMKVVPKDKWDGYLHSKTTQGLDQSRTSITERRLQYA